MTLESGKKTDGHGAMQHWESLRTDARDEIKRRIQQRDQYSMQLTVALGAVVIAAFSAKGTHWLFLLAPLIASYYTALILYSYRIHDVLAKYLREEIEPELANTCGLPVQKEWESWYLASSLRVGVRRSFFLWEMWIVTLLSTAFVWRKEWQWPMPYYQLGVLLTATVVYLILAAWVSSLKKVKKN